jgi:alpha-N-arabinofuranosidase
VLTAPAIDAHNTFQQPQAVVPAPFSAKPGPQGLVLELPPKSIVVVASLGATLVPKPSQTIR